MEIKEKTAGLDVKESSSGIAWKATFEVIRTVVFDNSINEIDLAGSQRTTHNNQS